MRQAEQDVALACVPGALPESRRAAHFALTARLFGRVQERQPLGDGYAYRLAAGELENIARFVAAERLCCPFLTFALLAAPGSDDVWLRITGPAGTPQFLDAELTRPAPALQEQFPH